MREKRGRSVRRRTSHKPSKCGKFLMSKVMSTIPSPIKYMLYKHRCHPFTYGPLLLSPIASFHNRYDLSHNAFQNQPTGTASSFWLTSMTQCTPLLSMFLSGGGNTIIFLTNHTTFDPSVNTYLTQFLWCRCFIAISLLSTSTVHSWTSSFSSYGNCDHPLSNIWTDSVLQIISFSPEIHLSDITLNVKTGTSQFTISATCEPWTTHMS